MARASASHLVNVGSFPLSSHTKLLKHGIERPHAWRVLQSY